MDRPTYTATDVSYHEAIQSDFERSRAWSLARHNQDVIDRRYARLHDKDAVVGVAVALVVVVILYVLKITVGVL